VSFDDFKSEDGGEPVDGEHTAWLEHAVVRDTRNGKAIKCEWRTTDLAYYWESWHNTSGGGKARTQELLGKMGIDLEQLSGWDELEDELAAVEDRAYIVKVSRSSDGRFVNTAIVERSQGVQDELRPDTTGLPEARDAAPPAAPAAGGLFDEVPAAAPVPAGGIFDDDDIPF
jgi:hypothetical protein